MEVDKNNFTEITVDQETGEIRGLSEKQYENLLSMKQDMHKYKTAKRDLQSKIDDNSGDAKTISDLQAENLSIKKLNSLQLAAQTAGIRVISDIALIEDFEVSDDSSIDDIAAAKVSDLKSTRPDLFGVPSEPIIAVDTTAGSRSDGFMSDDKIRALSGNELIQCKKMGKTEIIDRYDKLAKTGTKTMMTPALTIRPGAEV